MNAHQDNDKWISYPEIGNDMGDFSNNKIFNEPYTGKQKQNQPKEMAVSTEYTPVFKLPDNQYWLNEYINIIIDGIGITRTGNKIANDFIK